MASIITVFFFLLTMFIGHEKPLNYKRKKLKTFGAWLLVTLSLADMALAVCIALKVQSTYNELDYTFEFFKRYALSSILMFGWAIYIFKSGPLRSKKWGKVVKSILYFLSSFVLLGSSSSDPMAGAVAMVLTFVLFFTILLIDVQKNKKQQENEPIKEQVISHSPKVQFGNRIGRYVVKICVTLAMACFFIVCSDGFTHCDGMILLAFFYFPWFAITFAYYTYLLWSKKPVTGEKILLLPLLKKISLFQNYSADSIPMKKKLIKTVLPFLLTLIVCPFISIFCNDGDNYIYSALLCAIAPILFIISLVKSYSIKWLYSQNQSKDE